jgi:hypothetical protein
MSCKILTQNAQTLGGLDQSILDMFNATAFGHMEDLVFIQHFLELLHRYLLDTNHT